ncbi:hypothetical protein KIH77_02240 [Bifidobacterium sp. 82T24]|uniref:hypothetical protein n=1 Tax=Bifidobacterium pluvialisilvae TaxID=2834436 RepID=UPI001C583AC2|nr:hypothetical protein [Bifidobacterium pluvialisilvae]MBW3087561.1 hypothetical protein [Bifidobacterium pluvialisilvae]
MDARKIRTLPASVSILSQGNLQSLAYVAMGAFGVVAAVGCLARWLAHRSREITTMTIAMVVASLIGPFVLMRRMTAGSKTTP